jgi:hypothetical protein
MPKVDLELVKMILQRNELDIRTVSSIIEELNDELKAQADEEKPPPVKKQFVMMASDPDGKLAGIDLAGWVLQIPEEDSPAAARERLIRAAYAYNASPKGRRIPVKTIGEACEVVPARLLKEENVWVKTKEPVLLQSTDNEIPREKLDREG